jgi:chromosome segregation ATPase
LNDLKTQLSIKITNLINLFNEIKDKCLKSENSIMTIINEKQIEVIETVSKIKASLNDDINRARSKLSVDNKTKTQEIIEWYKKQIQELQPYKNKYNALDSQCKTLENSSKLLNKKLDDYKIKSDTLEKSAIFHKEKIEYLNGKIIDLEAKNSDIKNFVFSRISDEYLDEFDTFYNDSKKY